MITIILFFSVPFDGWTARFTFANSADNRVSLAAVWTLDGVRSLLRGGDFFLAELEVVFFADFKFFLLLDGCIFADGARDFAADGINKTTKKVRNNERNNTKNEDELAIVGEFWI